jgi:aryl-alcohol dehydrogenase-like predicted oxidoreductase
MKYRTYPHTDVAVSEVGFGLWTTSTGWWGNMTDDEAVRLLREARELGITLYDAADTYGNGRSEIQLAKAFGARRGEVVYATKFGYDFYNHAADRRGQQAIPQDFSPAYVRRALEESLRRLETDTIDIYQVHNARLSEVENDELFALLEQVKSEGKIRMYGAAFGPAIGWLVEGCRMVSERRLQSIHMIWNMLEGHPGDEMVQASYDTGSETGYLVRVPHSSGMLEGKFTAETTFERNDHRAHRPRSWLINGLKKLETLGFLVTPERTLGQAAIQWLLAEPKVMSVLPNIYDREQLAEFARAPETPRLNAEELARIAALAKTNFGVEEPPMNYKGTMRWEDLPSKRETAGV